MALNALAGLIGIFIALIVPLWILSEVRAIRREQRKNQKQNADSLANIYRKIKSLEDSLTVE